jgi:2-dehydro-3-deoxygalactonokinase
MNTQPRTALIALDWGTTSLRAYRMDPQGRPIDSRRSEGGIMQLPAGEGAARFEAALQAICGDWLQAHARAPLLACGMVGSAQGWCEAVYHPIPCAIEQVARNLTVVQRPDGPDLHIVPGLIQHGDLPNVMRGEETQIAGVLHDLDNAGESAPAMLIGLPGTHSKWAWIEQGQVMRFETFMTGEVYAALRQYTILGRTMAPAPQRDERAFIHGLQQTRARTGGMGVLSDIFSSRTLGLTGRLSAQAQPDYLSGLLIGHEVAALAHALPDAAMPVVLCGESELCLRYAAALEVHGLHSPQIRSGVTASGLWRIARAAALV